MIDWMIYVTALTFLLGAAALAMEYGARLKKGGTRWYWLGTIVASLLFPIVIASVSVQVPDISGARMEPKTVVLRDTTSIPLLFTASHNPQRTQIVNWISPDAVAKNIWLFGSLGMLIVLIATGLQVYQRKRMWRIREIAGTLVYVTPDVGPAVVGFLRPQIVVPAWLEASPAQVQSDVIAHERSHLLANDPQIFTLALCLIVLMPWNLPLWWQLHRLRHAIEVDCDARVIRRGADASAYVETLITVGEQKSSYLGAVAAMSESASFLERRMRIMLSKPHKYGQLIATVLALFSLTLVVAAAQISPPNTDPTSPKAPGQHVWLTADLLERYTGDYKLNDSLVMSVTRSGTQLKVRITGQPAFDIGATSPTHFYLESPNIKAELDFVVDSIGRATSVVLHQNGQDVTMPRIDPTLAASIEAKGAANIRSDIPTPGAEAAVRRFIERGEAGLPPEYETMSPQLAEAARQQQTNMQQAFSTLGTLQSLQFEGAAAQSGDAFVAKFEHGTMIYHIVLDSKGVITGLLMRPL